MIFLEHDADGRILSIVNFPTSERSVTEYPEYKDRLALPTGFQVDWQRHYVVDGEVVDRPSMAVSFDGRFLTGVPDGSKIIIDGVEYTADGSGSIELEFDLAATYNIKVTHWPFLDVEFCHENIAQV